MAGRQIAIYTTRLWVMTQNKLIFSDWYSFADWVKQENLYGRSVTITHWEYI